MPSAWLGKPCDGCGGRKGKAYAAEKYCGRCKVQVRKANKAAAHAAAIARNYGMTGEQYLALLALQGGACALCRRAKGISKRLAVDHDHACCPVTPTCGKCNRGLVCGTCNKILGHARDEVIFFARCMDYLIHPPWKHLQAESEKAA